MRTTLLLCVEILSMLLAIAAIVAGLVLLVWSADRFVMGAAALAHNLGVSSLLIGLTIVGFGTSAPEIVVSAMASLQGNPGLAVGNAIGSNIANIALILGATAIIAPLTIKSSVLRQEYPLLLGISIAIYVLLFDGELNFTDGVLMLIALIFTLWWMVRIGQARAKTDVLAGEYNKEIPATLSTLVASLWLVVGLLLLIASSRMLVWGAVEVATALGVSDLIIGLTIVAVGTSLPELATSITSALKGEHDIAVGNVIGSNIYNLLAVLSVPGLLAPTVIAHDVLTRDLPLMLALTLAILFMGLGFRGKDGRINRVEGIILLACFIGYQGWLIL
jgi:cation:H+ antiporter